VTHLAETFNEHGTPVSLFQCESCATTFTVCPAVPEDRRDQWTGCMADGCATYDEARDGEWMDPLFRQRLRTHHRDLVVQHATMTRGSPEWFDCEKAMWATERLHVTLFKEPIVKAHSIGEHGPRGF